MLHRLLWFALLVVPSAHGAQARRPLPASAPAQVTASAPAPPRYVTGAAQDPDGTGKFYMGREIARVMGHEAARWLDRPRREQQEQGAKMLAALRIRPGDVVADIGAGSGYYTIRLARLVGPSGRVIAVDIQQKMLDLIRKRENRRGLRNIDLVLGRPDDPNLAPESLDLVLMVDVYHEFEWPFEMMQHIVRALKPGGRVAFVEFRLEDPTVPIKLVHKMSEGQVLREMRPFDLVHRETVRTLPWQHLIIFEKPPPTTRQAP